MNTAKEYVESLKVVMSKNEKAVDLYDFVLERGVEFTSAPRPNKLPNGIDPRRFKLKECFYNAQLLALQYNYTYFEGFATSIIPTEHAWVLTHDNVLLDLTWDKVRNGNETFDYFGVKIPSEFIEEHMYDTGYSVSMLVPFWQHERGIK